MEYTYEDMNLIPNLTKLQKENISFNSNHGGYVLDTSGWTIAGMFGQTSGLPLKVSIDGNNLGTYDKFLPGVTSLGQILETNGYKNYMLLGSDKSFAGRDKYFEQHGNYQIWDLNSAYEEGLKTPDDYVWWGFIDSDLFSYAKDQLTKLNKDEPFSYILLTTDTHHPEGYLENYCEKLYDSHYANSIYCSNLQIFEFVNWIKKQSWYDNTTVILSGDHTSMNKSLFVDWDENYDRTTYFTILNSAIENNGKEREFTTLDLFPTTLASLGATIEGDRLGLGTNLFGDKYTYLEMYGFDYINKEVNKNSEFYNKTFYIDQLSATDSSLSNDVTN